MVTEDDFRHRESANGMTAEEFRFVQTVLLGMSNEELGRSLGYSNTNVGRKRVLDFREGRKDVPGTVVTTMWFLAFGEGDRPAWIAD